MWSKKFLAKAKLKGYKDKMNSAKTAPFASTVIDESAEKKKSRQCLNWHLSWHIMT